MTRFEIMTAAQSVLREADLPLTLVSLRALSFAWELRLEDRDGSERLITVHQGSAANIVQAIRNALQLCV